MRSNTIPVYSLSSFTPINIELLFQFIYSIIAYYCGVWHQTARDILNFITVLYVLLGYFSFKRLQMNRRKKKIKNYVNNTELMKTIKKNGKKMRQMYDDS